MNILSGFVVSQIVKALEEEFLKHEADMQAAILAEAQMVLGKLVQWVEDKLNIHHEA